MRKFMPNIHSQKVKIDPSINYLFLTSIISKGSTKTWSKNLISSRFHLNIRNKITRLFFNFQFARQRKKLKISIRFTRNIFIKNENKIMKQISLWIFNIFFFCNFKYEMNLLRSWFAVKRELGWRENWILL